jgi:hypothetical protein
MRECLAAFVDSIRTGLAPAADLSVARRVHSAMLACSQAEATRNTSSFGNT